MLQEIQQLAIVLTLAAAVGGLAKVLRLPMIFAYLVAGAILAASGIVPEATTGLYRLFGDLGVMFLLFLIGLEINYTSLKLVGFSSLLIGIAQIAISATIGTILALTLGLPALSAGYLGLTVAFASTVVVVKLLTERHELNSLHGKLVLGIMLVQDFVAMIILVALAGLQAGHGMNVPVMFLTVIKGVALFALMVWLGRFVAPRVIHHIAHSTELLFLVTIAWVFVIAALAGRFGLSIEIGGFLAGLALANSSEQFHIANRMRPLRDFFLVLLFITLGTSLRVHDLRALTGPILLMTGVVVIINPIIVSTLLSILGYHRRTAVMAGLHISQISEFSLVLAALGARLGHIDAELVSIITVSAILSIGLSSFLIMHSEAVYRGLHRLLHWSDERLPKSRAKRTDVIIIGANRLGHNILRSLHTKSVLVVDYDPDVIARLRRDGVEATYGDIGDDDVLAGMLASRPHVVISTSPNLEDNAGIITATRSARQRPLVVVRAENDREASRLYQLGADFVLLPHLMSGLSLGQALRRLDDTTLKKWRANDLRYLGSRI